MSNTKHLDEKWRNRVTKRVGGSKFDMGEYVFTAMLEREDELRKANQEGNKGSALLALSVADPTNKIHELAMEAGMEYFQASPDASRYTDLRGARATKGTIMTADTNEMIAGIIQERHEVALESQGDLDADWVQYSPGSIKKMLSTYLPALLFGERVQLLFPKPSYGVMADEINRFDIPVIDLPMENLDGRWMFSFDEAGTAVKKAPGGTTSVMYLNVPHNPTGRGFTYDEWQAVINWAIENDVTLVVDEAYIDLCYNQELVSVLRVRGWEKCCIVLQSVSKGWNATGLRFGYAIAHPTIIRALRKVMDVKDSGSFAPSIVAGIWCLLHPAVRVLIRENYRTTHDMLAYVLKEAGFASLIPEAGLCQLTPAPTAAGDLEFESATACATWLREELRISTMAIKADGSSWLRWAVTFRPVPECALDNHAAVIGEIGNRLKRANLKF